MDSAGFHYLVTHKSERDVYKFGINIDYLGVFADEKKAHAFAQECWTDKESGGREVYVLKVPSGTSLEVGNWKSFIVKRVPNQ